MPRTKRELTPFPPAKCWKKYRKGVVYYVGKGLHDSGNRYSGSNTSCPAYREALDQWRRIADKLEADEQSGIDTSTKEYQQHLSAWRAASEQSAKQPSTVTAIELAHAVASKPAPSLANVAAMASDYSALPTKLVEAGGIDLDDTSVNSLVRVYLSEKQSDVAAGEISPKMYAEHKGKLADFQGFAQHFGREDVNEVGSDVLSMYRNEQLRRCSLDRREGGISKPTARKRLQILKRFIEWAYKRETLDTLPRVLMGDYAKLKLEPPKPELYSVEEVRELYRESPPLLRAAILLGVNCGYYQTDVSSLDWSMIDQKNRIVARNRQKTGIEQSHRLWSVTLSALKQYSRKRSGLVLTVDGVPLLREEIGDDGNLKLYDVIAQEFRKLKRKLGQTGDGKGFSTLRNSAANEIEKHYQQKPWLTDQFLGHSVGAMKKHYVNQHFDELHNACDYLGTLYALDRIK